MKLGIVLEGGGMRGVYTSGVLDAFLEDRIQADYVIGVSAGACNGIGYVSGQKERSMRINIDYIDDKRYLSFSNFLKTKSLFGMDFIFNDMTYTLEPFDFDAFFANPCEFVAGVTSVDSGKPVYFDKSHMDHDSTILRASSSIPIFAPIVYYQGFGYLDGGTSDPIPVRKALADGCDKVIVVLTRDRGYVKPQEKYRPMYRQVFYKHPAMVKCLDERHKVYNETREYLWQLEKEGKALVIAPKAPIAVDRFEKDKERLRSVYREGFDDAKALKQEIDAWLAAAKAEENQ